MSLIGGMISLSNQFHDIWQFLPKKENAAVSQ